MELRVNYKIVRTTYPKAVAEVVAQLRKGKSKDKDVPAYKLTWRYEWGIKVQGVSLLDILSGEHIKEVELTEEEEVQERVRNTLPSLRGSIGRWWGFAQLPEVPQELVAIHRHDIHEARARKASYDALPKAEQDRQFHEALSQLRGTPGFMELHVPVRKP